MNCPSGRRLTGCRRGGCEKAAHEIGGGNAKCVCRNAKAQGLSLRRPIKGQPVHAKCAALRLWRGMKTGTLHYGINLYLKPKQAICQFRKAVSSKLPRLSER